MGEGVYFMDNELIELKLCNKENDFIYNFGEINGHTIIPNKILYSYFLSDRAKILYAAICGFAYGNKRDCFPTQVTLMDYLDWTKATLEKYLNELRNVGLIETVSNGRNKPLVYKIRELQAIKILYHSELLHAIRVELSLDVEEWTKRRKAYMKSELFHEVNSSENPFSLKDKVYQWFFNYGIDGTDSTCDCEEQSIKVTIGFNRRLPPVPPKYDSLVNEEAKNKRKKSVSYNSKALSDWNASDFCDYFGDQYFAHRGIPYYKNAENDVIFMKNVLRQRENKELVKTLIDLFMEHPEIVEPQNVQNFSSARTQQLLDTLLRTGSIPSFYVQSKKQEPVPQTSEDDFWKRD